MTKEVLTKREQIEANRLATKIRRETKYDVTDKWVRQLDKKNVYETLENIDEVEIVELQNKIKETFLIIGKRDLNVFARHMDMWLTDINHYVGEIRYEVEWLEENEITIYHKEVWGNEEFPFVRYDRFIIKFRKLQQAIMEYPFEKVSELTELRETRFLNLISLILEIRELTLNGMDHVKRYVYD